MMMRYCVLATDYDGTLAHDGGVDALTLAALQRFRDSGRHLVMVTGRELEDLKRVFPQIDLFELIIGENGALLYRPSTKQIKLLCEPPPKRFGEEMRARGAERLSVGHAIVATVEPHEKTALELIKEMGLELHVIFNKGSVMILPSGVNKATGLKAGLREIGLSLENTVGVGDAENDHAFLEICACGVAVSNALPALKEHADFVTNAPRGAGVTELIDRILATDLQEIEPHQRPR
jgi:hydroxymethylpyrimidine pyrophosphatase-like HAD family hydrolase